MPPTYSEAIRTFADKQREYNTKLGASLVNIRDDVKSLHDKIMELQNSPGTVSAEDQATLDELQSLSENLVSRLEEVDNMTPPPAPPVES